MSAVSRLASIAMRTPVLSMVARNPGVFVAQRQLSVSSTRLCMANMKDMTSDFRPDKMDKMILVRYGPKGKYSSSDSVPDQVSYSEMEAAKSRFRVRMMMYGMLICLLTAGWLIIMEKKETDEHQKAAVAKQKS